MVLDRVQPFLFLRNDPAALDRAVAFLVDFLRFDVQIVAARRFQFAGQAQKLLFQLVGAHAFLQIARSRLRPVFIVSVLAEQVDHRPDIVQHIFGRHVFLHEHAFAVVGPKTAGDIQLERAVVIGDKAHVAERRVHRIVHAVRERDLELARHFEVAANRQRVVGHRRRVRDHVERFAFFHARQRRAHDVARIVAAARLRVNLGVNRLPDDGRDLVVF